MLQKKSLRQSFVPGLLPLGISLFFGLLSLTPVYRNLSHTVSDLRWQAWYHPEKTDTSIVLVAIDNKSLEFAENNLNMSWPWPREFYGLVLNYLNASGVKSVTYDILFNSQEIGRVEFAGGSSDGSFARSIADYCPVILGAMIEDRPDLSALKRNVDYLSFSGENELPGPTFSSVSLPIPILLSAGAVPGIANFHTDGDGVCRRMPLLFKTETGVLPQLAFAAFLKSTEDSLISFERRTGILTTAKREIRLDRNGYYPLYWYGPGDADGVFRYDSFHALLLSAVKWQTGQAPDIPQSDYRDRHVIICASASGLVDLKATPFTAVKPYPGGEIHATLLSNLLQGHRLNSLPFIWIALLTFLIAAGLSFSYLKHRLRVSIALTAAALLLVFAVNILLFHRWSYDFDLIYSLSVIIFSGTGSSLYRLVNEGQAKKQLRNMFSRYLSNEVIDILLKDPDTVDLEGSEITGTVFFTDLQNFTTYSEDKTPRDVVQVLNRYFGIITGIVLENGGLLDKYTGDGIMAVFGAPIPSRDHARAACETILEFRRHNINEIIPTEGGVIATRIGVSSGPMVLGNLGSSQRMDYTAIGDTVNLSARLEGVNKSYGTTNILSEFTWEYVKDDYLFRELDFIRVKGKNHPIRIFTLIDRPGDCSPELLKREKIFAAAHDFYKKKDWKHALAAFEEFAENYPEDKAGHTFIERCKMVKKHPDLVDADGVFTFKTK